MSKPAPKNPRPHARVRADVRALREAWREWRAAGMQGAEPVTAAELNRRIGLMTRVDRALAQ